MRSKDCPSGSWRSKRRSRSTQRRLPTPISTRGTRPFDKASAALAPPRPSLRGGGRVAAARGLREQVEAVSGSSRLLSSQTRASPRPSDPSRTPHRRRASSSRMRNSADGWMVITTRVPSSRESASPRSLPIVTARPSRCAPRSRRARRSAPASRSRAPARTTICSARSRSVRLLVQAALAARLELEVLHRIGDEGLMRGMPAPRAPCRECGRPTNGFRRGLPCRRAARHQHNLRVAGPSPTAWVGSCRAGSGGILLGLAQALSERTTGASRRPAQWRLLQRDASSGSPRA